MLLTTHNKLLVFTFLTCCFMATLSSCTKTYYEHEQFNSTNYTEIVDLENFDDNNKCDYIVEEDFMNHTYDGLMKITVNYKTTYERKILQFEENNATRNRTNKKPKKCEKEDYCRKHDDTQVTYCFRKCCKSGEVFIGDNCVFNENFTFGIHDFGDFGYTDILPTYNYKPECDLRPYTKFLVRTNEHGAILTTQLDKYINITPEVHDYCFDMHTEDPKTPPKPYLYICLAKDNIRTQCLQVAFYISCVCLTMTIIIYCSSYKFGKIINWVIVSTCLSELCGFIFVSLRQLLPNIEDGCDLISFGTLVGLISAFSWLGVMGYDVWKTIASMKIRVGTSNLLNRYLFYSIFGWLYPIAVGMLAYLENQYSILPNYLHVNVGYLYRGRRYCKVSNGITNGNYSFLLFYIIPIAIPILCNVVCFIFTIRYIIQARTLIRKSSRATQVIHTDNNKLAKMVLKLFLIMGVNWVFEVISQIIDFKSNVVAETIEIVFDTTNCLQGLFIFLIFGLKWPVIKAKLSKLKENRKSVLTITESI